MENNIHLAVGAEVSNADIVRIFQCGNMGGMRRSKKTGTLVIISDDTKRLYKDTWKNGILYYTGMGKVGDQVLEGNQNGTLYHSNTNGVKVHLFEVMKKTIYTYRGIVTLADAPYQDDQLDNTGNMRKVWIFPVRPIHNVLDIIKDPDEKEVVRLSDLELIKRSEINQGAKKPQKSETTVYYRDPYIKEMVKRLAKGKCQFCGMNAPFLDMNGSPYLEEHHVKRLADGGADVIKNVVALCPNCHRKIHMLNNVMDNIVLEGIAEQNEEKLKRLLSYNKRSHKK